MVAAESVVERAIEKATELSALVPAAYTRTVEVVRGPVIAEMRAVDPRSIL